MGLSIRNNRLTKVKVESVFGDGAPASEDIVSFVLKIFSDKEDTELMRSVRRKMDRVKKLYPTEVRRLLPAKGTQIDLRVRGRRKRPERSIRD